MAPFRQLRLYIFNRLIAAIATSPRYVSGTIHARFTLILQTGAFMFFRAFNILSLTSLLSFSLHVKADIQCAGIDGASLSLVSNALNVSEMHFSANHNRNAFDDIEKDFVCVKSKHFEGLVSCHDQSSSDDLAMADVLDSSLDQKGNEINKRTIRFEVKVNSEVHTYLFNANFCSH